MKLFKSSYFFAIAFVLLLSSSFKPATFKANDATNLGSWVELVKQAAGSGVDYDRLEVPESEVSYKQLKFKVLKAPIYIRSIQILYTDKTSESHIITRMFKKKQSSRTIDLSGHGRFIKTILFTYRTRTTPKVKAELVVLARDK